MSRRPNRRRLLIPEARRGVEEFKASVMNQVLGSEIEQPDAVKLEVARQLDIPLKKEDNGEIRAKDAGKIGGVIGGNMVKEMIRLAQQSLVRPKS
jgi:hypothetical protein